MKPRILALAYKLRAYYFGEWPLDSWAALAPLAAAAILLLRWLWRGMPPLAAWRWLILGLLLILAVALLGVRSWAARRDYVVFQPAVDLHPPAGAALDPAAKLLHRATGWFEVQGKGRFFADLPAFWRTFETREHAIMAIVHDARFLVVGELPERDVGMWYIFFQPPDLTGVTPGQLIFGSAARPALRLDYRIVPTAPRRPGRRPSQRPLPHTVYLAFDHDSARNAVWADLLADRER